MAPDSQVGWPSGACLQYRLGGPEHGLGGDPLVGIELEEGWWTKARMRPVAAGVFPHYLCCRGAGRRVEYEYRDVAAVQASTPALCAAAKAVL